MPTIQRRILNVMTKTRIFGYMCALLAGASLLTLSQGRGGGTGGAPVGPSGPNWATYGGNLASHRYSPADQINKDNFKNLRIAWRLKTDFLGPNPDNLYSATPLYVNGVLYTTAGTRRAAIALDAGTGEMLWMHSENEGPRGDAAPRRGAAGYAGGSRVLLGSVDEVREPVVRDHVVELRGRLVVPGTPGVPAIQRDERALVRAEDLALRVLRVDPQLVKVIASRIALRPPSSDRSTMVFSAKTRSAFDGSTVTRPKYQPRCQIRWSPDARLQLAPRSSDRYSPPPTSASTMA